MEVPTEIYIFEKIPVNSKKLNKSNFDMKSLFMCWVHCDFRWWSTREKTLSGFVAWCVEEYGDEAITVKVF